MKKTLAAIAVVAMVFFATSAMAAGVKVPKSICIGLNGTFVTFTMTTSKGGTAVVSGKEKISHYDIQGSMQIAGNPGNNYPLHGSGYIKEGVFNFTFTSQWIAGSFIQNVTLRGLWDLTTATGTAALLNTGTGTVNETIFNTLFLVDCSTVIVPSEIEVDQQLDGDLETSVLQ